VPKDSEPFDEQSWNNSGIGEYLHASQGSARSGLLVRWDFKTKIPAELALPDLFRTAPQSTLVLSAGASTFSELDRYYQRI
jgi:hypothetical protein